MLVITHDDQCFRVWRNRFSAQNFQKTINFLSEILPQHPINSLKFQSLSHRKTACSSIERKKSETSPKYDRKAGVRRKWQRANKLRWLLFLQVLSDPVKRKRSFTRCPVCTYSRSWLHAWLALLAEWPAPSRPVIISRESFLKKRWEAFPSGG